MEGVFGVYFHPTKYSRMKNYNIKFSFKNKVYFSLSFLWFSSIDCKASLIGVLK
jgi:hypothetical protein